MKHKVIGLSLTLFGSLFLSSCGTKKETSSHTFGGGSFTAEEAYRSQSLDEQNKEFDLFLEKVNQARNDFSLNILEKKPEGSHQYYFSLELLTLKAKKDLFSPNTEGIISFQNHLYHNGLLKISDYQQFFNKFKANNAYFHNYQAVQNYTLAVEEGLAATIEIYHFFKERHAQYEEELNQDMHNSTLLGQFLALSTKLSLEMAKRAEIQELKEFFAQVSEQQQKNDDHSLTGLDRSFRKKALIFSKKFHPDRISYTFENVNDQDKEILGEISKLLSEVINFFK